MKYSIFYSEDLISYKDLLNSEVLISSNNLISNAEKEKEKEKDHKLLFATIIHKIEYANSYGSWSLGRI